MRAIMNMNDDEYNYYREITKHLEEIDARSLVKYRRASKHAKYDFNGSYDERLVKALGRHPTADEITIIIDGGFSHFGASATVDQRTMTFRGYVYTD